MVGGRVETGLVDSTIKHYALGSVLEILPFTRTNLCVDMENDNFETSSDDDENYSTSELRSDLDALKEASSQINELELLQNILQQQEKTNQVSLNVNALAFNMEKDLL